MNRELSDDRLEGFLRNARVDPATVCELRRIGTDDEMVRAIIDVWNEKLAPLGMTVSDEMPVWAEYFELIHVGEDYRPA